MSIEDFKKHNKKKAFKKRLLNIIFIPILILIFLNVWKKDFSEYRDLPGCYEFFNDKKELSNPEIDYYLDSKTNLKWYKCLLGQKYENGMCTGIPVELNWEETNNYIQDINLSSSYVWRLPDNGELKSLVENDCRNPAINPFKFNSIYISNLWSTTISNRGNKFACAMYTYDGRLSCMIRREFKYPSLLIVDSTN